MHGLSSFQVFGDFPVVLQLLISSWIPLCWRTHSDFNYFYLLRFLLWPRICLSCIWSVGTWKECVVYNVVIRWGVLLMLIRSCWLRVLLGSSVSLLIFLSSCCVFGTVVLRSPTVIVTFYFVCLSFQLSQVFFPHIFCSSVGSYAFRVAMYSWWINTNIRTPLSFV